MLVRATQEEDIERMKNSDVITEMVKELSTEFPSLVGPLITERDQFLACKLRSCPGDTIVAVVGTRSPFFRPKSGQQSPAAA
jgi:pheromone shutdown protein TraB